MKRLFLVGLIGCLLSLSAFAAEKNVPEVLNTFYKTFRSAEDVNWTQVNDMIRIDFKMNGSSHYAYYANEELLVVATKIKVVELPETLRIGLTKYEGMITEVYEMKKNHRIDYCVTINTPSKCIVLQGLNKWRMLFQEKKAE